MVNLWLITLTGIIGGAERSTQMLVHCELMLFTYYFRTWHSLTCVHAWMADLNLMIHTHGCTVSIHVTAHNGAVLKLCHQLGPPQTTGAQSGQAVAISPHWTTVVSPTAMNQTRPLSTALNFGSLLYALHATHTHTQPTNIWASSPLIRHDVSFHLISSDPCFFLIEAAANTIMVRIIPDWCEDGLTGLRR